MKIIVNQKHTDREVHILANRFNTLNAGLITFGGIVIEQAGQSTVTAINWWSLVMGATISASFIFYSYQF